MPKKIALVMSVRDEDEYLDLNIQYNLDLGFDLIIIADHCSKTPTKKILSTFQGHSKVKIVDYPDPVFDHGKIINYLIQYTNKRYEIDWFAFFDVDEFFAIKDGSIQEFIKKMEEKDIPYVTIGWKNALFDFSYNDYRAAAFNPIDTSLFYSPWPEKDWQEYGHFRKAMVKNHPGIEVVVGGHYVNTVRNESFFGKFNWNPFKLPSSQGRLLHFEFRNSPEKLYQKWCKLAEYEIDSSSSIDSPWMERINTIKNYVAEYKTVDEIKKKWFVEHRTFWGTIIDSYRYYEDNTLVLWFRKYFNKKLISGEIKTLSLVRSGHLGDVIMTEPVAQFLKKYVQKVNLITERLEVSQLLSVYDEYIKYDEFLYGKELKGFPIKLVYELEKNNYSYIQGFLRSLGFKGDEIDTSVIPILNPPPPSNTQAKFILLAPFTSQWEQDKRSWPYDKYMALKNLIEEKFKFNVIILEFTHSFSEMIHLIYNCEMLIGNDSAPFIIAQSFNKKSLGIFGATDSKYLHLNENASLIKDDLFHTYCDHQCRIQEIDCFDPEALYDIRVEKVFNKAISLM